jgi:hypothetical protein
MVYGRGWLGMPGNAEGSLNLGRHLPVALVDRKVSTGVNYHQGRAYKMERGEVRVPCTQSQIMQFVLVTGFLTPPWCPVPNPNPQARSQIHVHLLMRLARPSIDQARPCCRAGRRSSQDLSADKVVHALWVRRWWCITSLPATRDLYSNSRCDRQKLTILSPGAGRETNSTLTGTFAG